MYVPLHWSSSAGSVCTHREDTVRAPRALISIVVLFMQIVSQKVRALKGHCIEDDEDSLSFKNGEHVFLIDK